MANPSFSSADPSLASLLGDLITDAKNLLLQEVTLAKLEMQDELQKTKTAALSFAIGAGVAVAGGLLLLLMLVHLLVAFTTLPLWGCYGIIGGVLLVIGLIFLATGNQTAAQIEVVPPKTVETLKENAQWIKEQTTSNQP
jgi:hypothetical protein